MLVSRTIPMEVDVNGDAIPRDQGEFVSTRSFAEVVADQDTQVFRPFLVKAPVSVEQISHGQLKAAQAPLTVPAQSRPIDQCRRRRCLDLFQAICQMRSRRPGRRRVLSALLRA